MEATAEITAAVKNIPVLRFSGFEGEWVKKKLGDITKINQGLQIAISDRYTEKVEDSFFYITNEFLREGSQKKYFIKSPSASVLCVEEDLLMTRTGNTGLVVTGVSGAFHNNFFKIKYDDQQVAIWFLYYFLTSHKTQGKILKLAGASTIPDLNHSDFYRIAIKYPTILEQQKIASLLLSADDKIQQLSKKKELLEKYKKGVMQQIFCQQVRFKDDNGNDFPEWEEKKLGTIVEVKKGEQLNKIELTNTCQYPCINGGITPSGYTYKYNSEKDTITISEGGNSCGFVNIIRTNFWSGGHCYTLKAKNQAIIENEFLYQLLKYNEAKIMALRVGSGLPNIQKKDINSFKLLISASYEEQQKVANFLTSIDNKINYTSKQLEHAQQFKKGLLQQLFV